MKRKRNKATKRPALLRHGDVVIRCGNSLHPSLVVIISRERSRIWIGPWEWIDRLENPHETAMLAVSGKARLARVAKAITSPAPRGEKEGT